MTTLHSSVSITVPSTVDAVDSTDNAPFVKKVQATLSELFGGATTTNGVGSWISDTHGQIDEQVQIVTSYCEGVTDSQWKIILQTVSELKQEMSQEAIFFTVDGTGYIY